MVLVELSLSKIKVAEIVVVSVNRHFNRWAARRQI